jgi:hypothetical protein
MSSFISKLPYELDAVSMLLKIQQKKHMNKQTNVAAFIFTGNCTICVSHVMIKLRCNALNACIGKIVFLSKENKILALFFCEPFLIQNSTISL